MRKWLGLVAAGMLSALVGCGAAAPVATTTLPPRTPVPTLATDPVLSGLYLTQLTAGATTTVYLFGLSHAVNGKESGVLHLCVADTATRQHANGRFVLSGTVSGATATVRIATSPSSDDPATLTAANGGVDFVINEHAGPVSGHAVPATLAQFQSACAAIGVPNAQ